MLPKNLAFVDIETTGTRSHYDRIIEIGIVRVEENKLIKTFQTLINPQGYLPPEIVRITGIRQEDLENAPTFRQVKEEILETLIDCIFVAHNVRFDYSFLKSEFKREQIEFSSRHFCTVRLSRSLFPKHRHHNLDSIIERYGIPCENRHRALDDAKVLFHFFQKLQNDVPLQILSKTVNLLLKKPSIPKNLEAAMVDKLPEEPGVYIFYGEDTKQGKAELIPLYVGKSKNIKNRVMSHFSSDIRSGTEMNIAQQIKSIDTIITAGELGALFLESQLIKKLLPIYNKRSRIKRELVAVKSKINQQGYQEIYIESITTVNLNNNSNPLDASDIFSSFLGFFKSRKQAKNYLSEITKKYSLCEKLQGLEKTRGACFAYRLKQCNGACVESEKPLLYNLRFTTAFAMTKIKPWPFDNAIVITEQALNGKKDYFLIDKWCLLGSITFDGDDNVKTSLLDQIVFDHDMYQILMQYFKDNFHSQNIISLPKLDNHKVAIDYLLHNMKWI